jgi:Flp pilus assembly pilin Flp
MNAQLRNLWRDEAGIILSAEMVIILTISVLGMVVGLVNLQNALLGEFADLSMAFQSLNQSYSTPSYRGCWKYWGRTSWVAGSCFVDVFDGCVNSGAVGGYIGGDIISGSGYQLPAVTGQGVAEPAIVNDPNVVPSTGPALPTQGTPCPVPAPLNNGAPGVPQGMSLPALPAAPCNGCQ